MKSILSLIICFTVLLCSNVVSRAQSGDTQMYIKYTKLVAERDALQTEIDNATAVIKTLKRAKAKKMSKQLEVLQHKYDAAIRSISAFPLSVTDPEFNKEAQQRDTEEFRNEMARKLQEKLATMDMNAEATANIKDEELLRAYRNYKPDGGVAPAAATAPAVKIYYTVQIANGASGKLDGMLSLSGLHEVKQSDGKSYYCVGKFNDEFQAEYERRMLSKSSSRYRDAFVAAFMGTTRISVEEAQRLSNAKK